MCFHVLRALWVCQLLIWYIFLLRDVWVQSQICLTSFPLANNSSCLAIYMFSIHWFYSIFQTINQSGWGIGHYVHFWRWLYHCCCVVSCQFPKIATEGAKVGSKQQQYIDLLKRKAKWLPIPPPLSTRWQVWRKSQRTVYQLWSQLWLALPSSLSKTSSSWPLLLVRGWGVKSSE